MANVVGYIKNVKGRFVAEAKDGTIRILEENSPVYEGDAVYLQTDASLPDAAIVGTEDNRFVDVELLSGKTYSLTAAGYQLFEPAVMGKDLDFVKTSSNENPAGQNTDPQNLSDDNQDSSESGSGYNGFNGFNGNPQNPFGPSNPSGFGSGAGNGPEKFPEYGNQPEEHSPYNPTEFLPTDNGSDNFIPSLNSPPVTVPVKITVTEGGDGQTLGIVAPIDADGDPLTILVTTIPDIGIITMADGTPVKAGDSLTTGELTGLIFVPPADYEPGTKVGEFTYTVADGQDIVPGKVEIVVLPTNDLPIALDDKAIVSEDSAPATGNLLLNDSDIDATDVIRVIEIDNKPENVGNNVPGKYGTINVGPNGDYSYTLDNSNPAVQALGKGETFTETFTYKISDGNGGFDSAKITITINGTNDVPVAILDVNAITEGDSDPVTGNVLGNDSDVDRNDVLGVTLVNGESANVGVAVSGKYGTVTINSDGSYAYNLNNNNPAVIGLLHGEITTDKFTYQISDGKGGFSTATLTITINGENILPVAIVDTKTISEDAVAPVTGNVIGNDIELDPADTLKVVEVDGNPANVGVAIVGLHGTVKISPDGSYSYELNNSDPTVQQLGVGQSINDIFVYKISDGAGGFDSAKLTITINGTNDAPVAVADASYISNGDLDGITGNLISDFGTSDTDIDGDTLTVTQVNGEAANVNAPLTTSYGVLTVHPDGSYDYRVDNTNATVIALGHGETLKEVFTYQISDGNGGFDTATLTITVNGVNDFPAAVADVNFISEDAILPATGNVLLNDSDPDNTDVLQVTELNGNPANIDSPFVGAHGTIILKPDGSYTYKVNNSDPVVQALSVGETITDKFSYKIGDGNGGYDTATLTITINGTNDAPVAQADFNEVTSGVVLPVTGNLISDAKTGDSDLDGDSLSVTLVNGQAAKVGQSFLGDYGTVTINSDGSYSYLLNNGNSAVVSLAHGEKLTDSFSYQISDGNGGIATSTLTITVQGANDAPFAVADINSIKEDAVTPVTGNVLANDTDPDITDILRVTEIEGLTGNVGESVVGAHGRVVINSDGSYRYFIDNTDQLIQALGVGESATDSFTYKMSDGNGGYSTATLTITIDGTNDAPVAVADLNSVNEDSVAPAIGNVLTDFLTFDSDLDGDSLTVTKVNGNSGNVGIPLSGIYGTVTLSADGTYSYALNNASAAVQALAVGESVSDIFTYQISDSNGGSDVTILKIIINGTNDAPIVSVVDVTGAVTEMIAASGNLTDTGTITFTDVDLTDTHSISTVASSAGALGSLTATLTTDTTGTGLGGLVTWGYTVPAASIEYLAVGQTKVETFTFDVLDGKGGVITRTVSVTITGTNDAPIVALTDVTGAVTEIVTPSGNLTDTGTITFTDIDLTDIHSLSAVTPSAGALGSLAATVTTDTTGTGLGGVVTWGYTVPATSIEYLAAGQTKVETFTFAVLDGKGGSVTRTVEVTITGTNDAPIVALTDVAGAVTEMVTPSGNLTDTGTITFTDVDLTDTHSISAVAPSAGALGSLAATITADTTGSGLGGIVTWGYTVPATSIEYLAAGQTKVETFTFAVLDGKGGSVDRTVEVTITGTNDVPIVALTDITGAVTEMVTPSGNVTDTGTISFTDVDLTDVHSLSAVTPSAGALGSLTATVTTDSTGTGLGGIVTWGYTVPATSIEYLAAGQTKVETFSFDVLDGKGGIITRTVNVTITGTNDAPMVALTDVTGAVSEMVTPSGNLTDTGTIGFTDVDLTDSHSVSVVTPSAGALGSLTATVTTDTTGTGLGGVVTWGYTVPATSIEYLAAGQTKVETFSFDVLDGKGGIITRTVNVTITGTNDAPIVALTDVTGAVSEMVTPSGNLTDTGTISFTDVDLTDVHSLSAVTPSAGALGSLAATVTTDTTGTGLGGVVTWGYTVPATSVEYLAAGQTKVETFSFDVLDGKGGIVTRTVNVTITGTNDAPIVALTDVTVAVTEMVTPSGNLTDTGTIGFTDVDLTDAHSLSAVTPSAGALGSLTAAVTADTTGTGLGGVVTWGYTVPATSIEYLAAGQTKLETFTFAVLDGKGGSVSRTVEVTITGTNDVPVVALTDITGAVTEMVTPSGNLTDTGTINFTDVDLADAHSIGAVTPSAGALGSLTATVTTDTTGTGLGGVVTWGYTVPATSVEYLAAGQTKVETFTFDVLDGKGGIVTRTVNITITGTNDAPVAVADSNSIFEDAVAPVTGNVITDAMTFDSDVDSGDTLTVVEVAGLGANVGVAKNGSYGAVTINSDGSYSYAINNANPAVQALNHGATLTDSFAYKISDGHGGFATTNLAITINGVNDAPVANDVSSEGNKNAASIPITLTATDVDSTISSFKITTLPPNGTLYLDSGFATAINTSTDYAAAGNALTLYFKPDYATVDGGQPYGTNWYDPASSNVQFTFVAKDANTSDGVTYSADRTATITVDDVPYANNATVGVTENFDGSTVVSVSGNFITDGANFAAGKDYIGTDGLNGVYQIKFTDAAGNYGATVLLTSGTPGAGGYNFNADHGKIFVKADGTYTFIPNGSITHPADGSDVVFKLGYTIKDSDGDISNFGEQVVNIHDGAAPTIGAPGNNSVDEADLPNGTSPTPAALIVTGSLAVTTGTDAVDVKFLNTQSAIDTLISSASVLSSGSVPLTYVVSGDGHTLTGKAGANDVFTVVVNNPNNIGGAAYTFTLLRPLDHEITTSSGGNINLDFAFTAVNDDDPANDFASSTFRVVIVDDNPVSKIVNTTEDVVTPVSTNADATSANTSIFTNAAHGTTTVNANGSITYTPSTHFSGQDTFIYRTTPDDGGAVADTTVTVNVAPVSDAPTLELAKTVSGNEDVAIALGLVKPVIVDNNDQNGASAGDRPERIGLIELSGIPNGVTIKNGGSTIFTGNGTTLKIFINDDANLHYTGLNTGGSVSLTSAQYAALTATSAANNATDYAITVKAVSYELNDDGTYGGVIPGATSTQVISVDVLPVTDPVTLSGGTAIGNEDSWIRIDNIVTFGRLDTDGSETYTLKFGGELPTGTVYRVNGGAPQSITLGTGFNVPFTSGTLPVIEILPSSNNSADFNNLTVTIEAKDSDADSSQAGILVETATAAIVFDITPVANDISVAGGNTAKEDTKIPINLVFTNNDIASESVQTVTIAGIPAGSTIYKADGTTVVLNPGTNDLVIDVAGANPANEDVTLTLAEIEGLKILPPQDYSGKMVLTVSGTTLDLDDGGGQAFVTGTFTKTVTLTVEGVVDTTLGDADIADAGRLYVEIANANQAGVSYNFATNEDTKVDLVMAFQNYENKTHATSDGSEVGTFLIRNAAGNTTPFSIVNAAGVNLGTKTATGWLLTAAQLADAHFMPGKDYSGVINLELVTTVKDGTYDTNTQVDPFTVTVAAVPDVPTIQVRSTFTPEDQPVKFDVRPYSTDVDGSETVKSVLIAGIPAGTVITLGIGGPAVFTNDSGANDTYTFVIGGSTETGRTGITHTSGTITLADLGNLYFVPPKDSNGIINLQITPTVTENGLDQTSVAPIPYKIFVAGVTDTPPVTLTDGYSGNSEAGIRVAGANIGDGTNNLPYSAGAITVFAPERVGGAGDAGNLVPIGFKSSTGETASDISEKLSYVIEGVPNNFQLVDASGNLVGKLLKINGTTLSWAIDKATVDAGIYLKPPADYSGTTANLNFVTVVAEDDGHANRFVTPFSVEVAPKINTVDPIGNVTGIEDAKPDGANVGSLIILKLDNTSDATNSEVVTDARILTSGIPAGMTLYVNNAGSWVTAASVPGLVKFDGTNNYYDLNSYYNGKVAVGISNGGVLAHAAGTVAISGVSVTVQDGGEYGFAGTVSHTFADNINVTLTGVADQPTITTFAGSNNAGDTSGDVVDLNISAIFPDINGGEDHYYILKTPVGFFLNHGTGSGDGTWMLEASDLAGLQIKGPDGYLNAPLSLTAYSVENGIETNTATITISDSNIGSASGSGTSTPAAPNLSFLAVHSENEGGSFTLADVIASTSSSNASQTLSFIISELPAGAQIAGSAGVTVRTFTNALGATAYRVDVANGTSTADALNAVTITPKDNSSGDFNFKVDATLTATGAGFHASTPDAVPSDALVRVLPIADVFTVDSSAMTTNIIEDQMTQVKFTLNSNDNSTNANDLPETIDNVNISVASGKLVYLNGTEIEGDNNIVVSMVGGIAKYAGQDVYFKPVVQAGGAYAITVTADTHDTTSFADAPVSVTSNLLAQTGTITINVSPAPDSPDAVGDPNGATDSLVTNMPVGGYLGTEDTAVQLNLAASFADNDGSEFHTILLRGMPDGALLQKADKSPTGQNNGDGTWMLTIAELSNLYYAPSPNQSGTVTIQLVALAMEKTDLTTLVETVKSFDIVIGAVADGAIITPFAASGVEDGFVAVNLDALLVEQGQFNASPVTNAGTPFVSDETYNAVFSGYSSPVEFFYKDGSNNYIALPDATPGTPADYAINGLTQTQIDNLFVIVGDNFVGTMPINVAISTSEANGNTSSTITDSLQITTTAAAGDDIINGTAGNDHLFGRSGNDTINGLAGSDYISAGAGNDSIAFDSADNRIDGGTGVDTLILQNSDSINFDSIASGQVRNIESLDLATGDHSISNLGINDLLDMTDSSNQLTILGNAGDNVSLKSGDGGTWIAKGTVTDAGHNFDLFVLSSDATQLTLRIEHEINSNII